MLRLVGMTEEVHGWRREEVHESQGRSELQESLLCFRVVMHFGWGCSAPESLRVTYVGRLQQANSGTPDTAILPPVRGNTN